MGFICKTCGSQLEFKEGQLSSKCESCGNTYMVFDFLDKNSRDYQEQSELLEEEKRRYDNLYQQYADDVIEADSYCLKSSDFIKAIYFFQTAEKSEETSNLLELAKFHFIKRVSSYADCLMAIKYLDDIDGSLLNNKNEIKASLNNLAYNYRRTELIQEGLAIEIPKEKTENELLELLKSISNNNSSQETLEPFELEITNASRGDAIRYVDKYGEEIINNIALLSNAQKILTILNELERTHKLPNCSFFIELVGKRIKYLIGEERRKADLRQKEEEKEKARSKIHKICFFSIVAIVTVAFICFVTYRIFGYSSSNISMQILSKTNDTYNENLASGNIGAGYFYDFAFEVENNSPYDIKLIRGNMEIINKQGQTLSTSSIEMQGSLSKKSTQRWNIQLNVDKGENAREIWNTDLDDLKITFKIKTVYFADGTNKSYGNSKNIVIHQIEN